MSDIILDPGMMGTAIPKPNEGDIARRGARRLVKLVPMPGSFAAPAIWTTPEIVATNIEGNIVPCRVCIVLVTKSPPETMRITIPSAFYDALPEIPVEW